MSLNKLRLRSRRDEGEWDGRSGRKKEKERERGTKYARPCIIINRPGANRGVAEGERTTKKKTGNNTQAPGGKTSRVDLTANLK